MITAKIDIHTVPTDALPELLRKLTLLGDEDLDILIPLLEANKPDDCYRKLLELAPYLAVAKGEDPGQAAKRAYQCASVLRYLDNGEIPSRYEKHCRDVVDLDPETWDRDEEEESNG